MDNNTKETVEQLVTDEQLIKAWGNANFGNTPKREVIFDTLKKVAQGWGTGHTAMCIVRELYLVEKRNGQDGLSDKGFQYLLAHAGALWQSQQQGEGWVSVEQIRQAGKEGEIN